MESNKPEIIVTFGLATCLVFLCLGFLFCGDNNSLTLGVVCNEGN